MCPTFTGFFFLKFLEFLSFSNSHCHSFSELQREHACSESLFYLKAHKPYSLCMCVVKHTKVVLAFFLKSNHALGYCSYKVFLKTDSKIRFFSLISKE